MFELMVNRDDLDCTVGTQAVMEVQVEGEVEPLKVFLVHVDIETLRGGLY